MPSALLPAVADLVAQVVGPGRTPERVDRETRLAQDYWLDSIELLEVLMACERAFAVRFDEQRDLSPGTLDTLGSLVDLVAARRAAEGRIE